MAQVNANLAAIFSKGSLQHSDSVSRSRSVTPTKQVSHRISIIEDGFCSRLLKTEVQLQVVFLKIGDIDTLNEQYSAEIFMQAKWREPALDDLEEVVLKQWDFSTLWNPKLYVENLQLETKESIWQTATVTEKGEAFITECRKLRGIFLENLELEAFPFDVQDLSITVVSERSDDQVVLVPDEEEPSAVSIIGTFADEQEWNLYQHVEVTSKVIATEFTKQNRTHSALQITCRAARRPGYFYYNVFLVMFFITAMAFGTFSVDCNLPQNRLHLSFTLLLTSITFKMVINQSLPKISYLTIMDKYVLMSLVFLVVICIWHSIVPSLCADKSPESFYTQHSEIIVLVIFILLYIIGHIIFIALVYVYAWKKRFIMTRKDFDYRLKHCAMAIKNRNASRLSRRQSMVTPAVFAAA